MKVNELREAFIEYFQERDHRPIPSASLVPHGDPTLLFTTAGMVQFKPYFLGLERPPAPRLTSIQRCFRTSDVEEVGDDDHLTFFEMLGNFSIGDYFKSEAISWSWEFLTDVLGIPGDRLWATVYVDDDEAYELWSAIGLPDERILRYTSEQGNWWGPPGDTGPMGPCSELHYDWGPNTDCETCNAGSCHPDEGCGRFLEIWNLVFMQYELLDDGSQRDLPAANIDTGAGLERLASVLQAEKSVYMTDELKMLITQAESITGHEYDPANYETAFALRAMSEHARAFTFLVTDGVLPSNEGRGYVLRRLIRRAVYFSRKLDVHANFFAKMVETAIDISLPNNPDLHDNRQFLLDLADNEESRFRSTLDRALSLLEGVLEESRATGIISGKDAFTLYDTHGLPPELTREVALSHGFQVDLTEFEVEMEEQRERSKNSSDNDQQTDVAKHYAAVGIASEFVGYADLTSSSTIRFIETASDRIELASDEISVIFDQTPFYPEGGGQISDTGTVSSDRGQGVVIDVQRFGESIVHRIKVTSGHFHDSDSVNCEVDPARRLNISRNHTATHLLHSALRSVLGEHVRQAGSYVGPDYLRFDYTHPQALADDELEALTEIVSSKTRANIASATLELPYEEAIERGAIAFFEDRYTADVRMVEYCDTRGHAPEHEHSDHCYSRELCGGTHLSSTGLLGDFLILSDSSIGAGLRRIEACTGDAASIELRGQLKTLRDVAHKLQTNYKDILPRIEALEGNITALESELKQHQSSSAEQLAQNLAEQAKRLGDTNLLLAETTSTQSQLREISDELQSEFGSLILVLASTSGESTSLLVSVSNDLISREIDSRNLVAYITDVTGGGGGGRPQLAQAGIKDSSRLHEAYIQVEGLLRAQLMD